MAEKGLLLLQHPPVSPLASLEAMSTELCPVAPPEGCEAERGPSAWNGRAGRKGQDRETKKLTVKIETWTQTGAEALSRGRWPAHVWPWVCPCLQVKASARVCARQGTCMAGGSVVPLPLTVTHHFWHLWLTTS